MSKFKKIIRIIYSIFLPFVGIFLIGFHKKLEIDILEASLFSLVFIELGVFKQFQLEVEDERNRI